MSIEVKSVQLIEDMDGLMCRGSLILETLDADPKEFIIHSVRKLYVPPKFRKQGIATGLMRKVMEIVPDSFMLQPEPWADAPMSTESLRRWYTDLGLCESDQTPGLFLWFRNAQP